jgi:hypothetical protein
MKYRLDLSPKVDVSAPSVTGAQVAAPTPRPSIAWQPSTWPAAPATVSEEFIQTLKRIFEESILSEINNVIADAQKSAHSLEHRGHVVAISLMCALDAIASYGYRGKRGGHIQDFIANHFPKDYQPYAADVYGFYRCSLVHSWNLFEAAIYPGREAIRKTGGTLSFGLLDFFEALVAATADFLERLQRDANLQGNTRQRYESLRKCAKP